MRFTQNGVAGVDFTGVGLKCECLRKLQHQQNTKLGSTAGLFLLLGQKEIDSVLVDL